MPCSCPPPGCCSPMSSNVRCHGCCCSPPALLLACMLVVVASLAHSASTSHASAACERLPLFLCLSLLPVCLFSLFAACTALLFVCSGHGSAACIPLLVCSLLDSRGCVQRIQLTRLCAACTAVLLVCICCLYAAVQAPPWLCRLWHGPTLACAGCGKATHGHPSL